MTYPRLNADRSEQVAYDSPDYPIYIRQGVLSAYPDYRAESHWHDDIELIRILSGHMLYNVNGQVTVLREGEGIFVNARQLHFGYSDDRSECAFICVLLHPLLLCASGAVEEAYITPLLRDERISFVHLTQESPWGACMLRAVHEMFAVSEDRLSVLKIQRAFLDVWIALCENIPSVQKEAPPSGHALSILKEMIAFLQQNYRNGISLADIARAGHIGKTGCCSVFKKYTNRTPIAYLTELRLRKGMELLRRTDMTVLEISYETGFSSASYFTECFRRYYGCTPRACRSALRGEEQPRPTGA